MPRASRTHCEETDITVAQQFNLIVAAQKYLYRAAGRTLTNRSGGGLLEVEGADTKSGRPVIDVLREKHPPLAMARVEEDGWSSFESYPRIPDPLPVDCKQGIVEREAFKLRGGAGPSGADSLAWED